MLSLVFAKSVDDPFNPMIAKWVMERTNMHRALIPGTYTAIGVVKVGQGEPRVIAGILYHDFARVGSAGRIEVSMAADDPGWARRGVISAILHYPFIQANCHVLIATTTRANRRTRKFLGGIGFKERGIIPNRPFADDTVIYALRREDAARWLPQEPRQEAA
jgi:RimJ/RimL family protein N-acetyltransferase